ncbi:hypothetical protein H6P81_020008 [Aristolochia fimbriata]|uniref:Secreted protein n=1 Tax=Aristolochia fimbriata TaxID=158543 RepID=A0AAV7DU82_ARIFI|nr:hypothetical protein H6P81_020008 [Aristolochia fimbriata]
MAILSTVWLALMVRSGGCHAIAGHQIVENVYIRGTISIAVELQQKIWEGKLEVVKQVLTHFKICLTLVRKGFGIEEET